MLGWNWVIPDVNNNIVLVVKVSQLPLYSKIGSSLNLRFKVDSFNHTVKCFTTATKWTLKWDRFFNCCFQPQLLSQTWMKMDGRRSCDMTESSRTWSYGPWGEIVLSTNFVRLESYISTYTDTDIDTDIWLVIFWISGLLKWFNLKGHKCLFFPQKRKEKKHPFYTFTSYVYFLTLSSNLCFFVNYWKLLLLQNSNKYSNTTNLINTL